MKKLLGILVAIGVLVVVIVVVAIPIINNQASTLLSDTLKDQIALQGLEGNVAYDSITVDSLKGSVIVQGLTVQDFNFVDKIRIGEVIATVPVKDIVSLARSPEDGVISDVHLAITGVEMAMKIEDVDVSLDLDTSEVQINGRLDMNFIENLLIGRVETGIPQVDLIRLSVDNGKLKSSDVSVSMGSLLSEMGTVLNSDNEPVNNFQLSMANVSMDVDTGGEKTNTILVDRYETQVQGQVILDLLEGLASGNLEIDTSLVDSVNMNLEGGELITPELSMSVGSFTANLDGLDSVLALIESNPAIVPEFSGEMKLADYTLVLNDELREEFLSELEKTVGPLPFLRDPESWKVDTLQMKLSLENGEAELSDLACNTDWLDISGSSSLSFSEDMQPSPPFEADIRVAEYPEALRPLLEMTAFLLGTDLPKDNSFTMQINDGSIRWGNI